MKSQFKSNSAFLTDEKQINTLSGEDGCSDDHPRFSPESQIWNESQAEQEPNHLGTCNVRGLKPTMENRKTGFFKSDSSKQRNQQHQRGILLGVCYIKQIFGNQHVFQVPSLPLNHI